MQVSHRWARHASGGFPRLIARRPATDVPAEGDVRPADICTSTHLFLNELRTMYIM